MAEASPPPGVSSGRAATSPFLSGRLPVLLLVLAAALPFLTIPETLHDDAWITYRYAWQLATGEGLVYNPGERVLGTTTPGYALLLGLGGWLTRPEWIPLISRFLNLACLAGAGLLLYAEARRRTDSPALGAVAAGLLLLAPRSLHAGVAGMETPLFIALLVGAGVMLSRERVLPAAVLAGLLPWVRPEGVIVVGLLGAHLLLVQRRTGGVRPAPLAALVVPTVLGLLAAWLYYGALLPHSITAKQAGLYPIPVAGSALSTLALLGQTLTGLPTPGTLGWTPAVAALVLVLGGGAVLTARDRRGWLLPVLVLLLVGLYATSRTVLFSHYMAHLELPARLCIWAGLAALGARLLPGADPPPARRRVALVAAGVLVVASGLGSYPIRSVASGTLTPGDAWWSPTLSRQLVYEQLARALAPRVPPGTTVALPEIGELGWHLPELRVLDTAGLVSEEAVEHHPIPPERRADPAIGAIPPTLIEEERPELLVTLEIFGRHGLLEEPWFDEAYATVVELEGPWLPWDSRWLRVYSRRDFAPGMALAEGP